MNKCEFDIDTLVSSLNKAFPTMKAVYDKSTDKICYETSDATKCDPVNTWIKAIMGSWYYKELMNNKSLESIYKNDILFMMLNRSEFMDESGKLKKDGVLKLVENVTMCYSTLNDDAKNKAKNSKNKELTYYSYGWRGTSMLTPDKKINIEDNPKRVVTPVTKSYDDCFRALEKAYTSKYNTCSPYISKGYNYSGDINLSRYSRLISLIPLYHVNDIIISTTTDMYKCNLYVGDVLFGVLDILIRLINPWDYPQNDPAENIHNLLKSKKIISNNGRIQQVFYLYKACMKLLEKSSEIHQKDSGAKPPQESFHIVGSNNELTDNFGYIDFLSRSKTSNLSRETYAPTEKDQGYINDFHHVEIYVSGSPDEFFSISAHEAITSIADGNDHTEFKGYNGKKTNKNYKYSQKIGNYMATKDNYVAFVPIFDVIEALYKLYRESYID